MLSFNHPAAVVFSRFCYCVSLRLPCSPVPAVDPNILYPFFIMTQLPTAQDRLHGDLNFCKEMINNQKTEKKEEAISEVK